LPLRQLDPRQRRLIHGGLEREPHHETEVELVSSIGNSFIGAFVINHSIG
jgi:hypothetical protein